MDVLRRTAAFTLLEDLLEAGFKVQADRTEDMVYVGPSSRLTPEIRERIRKLKPALLDVMAPKAPDGPCRACGETSFVRTVLGPWRCARCTDLPPEEIASGFVGPDRWREEQP